MVLNTTMLILFLPVLSYVEGRELHVPREFRTIQAAINAARDGDIVSVYPGRYTGEGNRDISFFGKNITLRSTDGPAVTIIDSEGSPSDLHRGFWIIHGETQETVIEGFTVTGGYLIGDTGGSGALGGGGGAGFYIRDSSPTIRNCIIDGNTSDTLQQPLLVDGRAAGIYVDGNSNAIIDRCIITNNHSGKRGGAIYVGYENSDVVVKNSLLAHNTAHFGGGAYVTFGGLLIMNCTVSGNEGGGLVNEHAILTINSTIVSGNTSPELLGNGPIHVFHSAVGGATEDCCGSQVDWTPYPIAIDPQFVDPDGGDFRLAPESLAINAGMPGRYDQKSTDLEGNDRVQECRVDMGAYESPYFGDCNDNGFSDACDIADSFSLDCDENHVPDECEPMSIASSMPPDGAVDARQPSDLSGKTSYGWSEITLNVCGDPTLTTPEDFDISVTNGEAPEVDYVLVNDDTVTVVLTSPIPVGACTRITHLASDTFVTLHYAPGNVNGGHLADGQDLQRLIDHLSGSDVTLPLWQCDINRSGMCEPQDLLRLIDLLIGAEAYDIWAGTQFPQCPPP